MKYEFEITSEEPQFIEGMYVYAEQFGIGVVLEPEKWFLFSKNERHDEIFDKEKHVHVMFLGYSPAVIMEREGLKQAIITKKDNTILSEDAMANRDDWFAPASLKNRRHE